MDDGNTIEFRMHKEEADKHRVGDVLLVPTGPETKAARIIAEKVDLGEMVLVKFRPATSREREALKKALDGGETESSPPPPTAA